MSVLSVVRQFLHFLNVLVFNIDIINNHRISFNRYSISDSLSSSKYFHINKQQKKQQKPRTKHFELEKKHND